VSSLFHNLTMQLLINPFKDCVHFHQVLANACSSLSPTTYKDFKKGSIFLSSSSRSLSKCDWFSFCALLQSVTNTFILHTARRPEELEESFLMILMNLILKQCSDLCEIAGIPLFLLTFPLLKEEKIFLTPRIVSLPILVPFHVIGFRFLGFGFGSQNFC